MSIHTAAAIAALTVSAGSLLFGTQASAHDALHDPSYQLNYADCGVTATQVITGYGYWETTSRSYQVLNGGNGYFGIYMPQSGCLFGSFFANAGNGSDGDHVLLQIVLDGTPCAPQGYGGYRFANSGDDFSSHATGFYCGNNIASGYHSISVEAASELGGPAEFYQWTWLINHN